MLKILLVDSWLLNNKVIEQDSKVYLDGHDIKYQFLESKTPEDAIKLIKEHQPQIAFIDISSKQFDGIQLLKDIKKLEINHPTIIAATTLCDKKYRYEALKLNVYRYIYKPYDYKEIIETLEKTLEKYFKDTNTTSEILTALVDDEQDDFFDFDEDDEFMDFDNDDEIDHSKELMDAYNDSHKKVTAKEFLSFYSEQGIDSEEFTELEEELDTLISHILFDDNLKENLPEVIDILEKYNRFLYMFSEFEELSKVIYGLVELLNNINFDTLKRTKMTSKFIVAIIEDLFDWKEHVFVLKDAVDVYYINASILNSYVQLKDIVKT